MAWSGWGAGPAGAGSQRPTGRFLWALAVGSGVVTVVLALEGAPTALLTGAAAAYFALRASGRLGPKDPP